MDRLACADLPALALQLLLRRHPEWKAYPAAVVDVDEPTGTLLWLNERAWRARLRPGMRYASALALDGSLRAGTVSATEIESAVGAITAALRLHTPNVEPSADQPGVFWLDASGLESLYTSIDAWARTIARRLVADGYDVHLACGFSRFGTYALARTLAGRVLVCRSEDEERRRMRDVALERLGIEPKLRDVLARLGVQTIGQFMDLPAEGIRRRFGNDAWVLHRRARGEAWDPLAPLAAEQPLERVFVLDDPVSDSGILLFLVRRLVAELAGPIAASSRAIAALHVRFHRSLKHDTPPLELDVRAAEPTLDENVLADLVRLRLEAEVRRELSGSSIAEIEVHAEAAPAGREQLRLFHERTKRDLAAGSRALARIKAELGEASVVRAALRQGHLPEAGFAWESIDKVVAPSPRVVRERPLVRRIEERPLALPPRPLREREDCWIASPAATSEDGRNARRPGSDPSPRRRALRVARDERNAVSSWDEGCGDARRSHDDEGCGREPAASSCGEPRMSMSRDDDVLHRDDMVCDARAAASGHARSIDARGETGAERAAAHGRVETMTGPYIVSGGWWNREMHREYHYAKTESGEILWVYYDRRRRRWFLAGRVE